MVYSLKELLQKKITSAECLKSFVAFRSKISNFFRKWLAYFVQPFPRSYLRDFVIDFVCLRLLPFHILR